jgi:hypothetical protein
MIIALLLLHSSYLDTKKFYTCQIFIDKYHIIVQKCLFPDAVEGIEPQEAPAEEPDLPYIDFTPSTSTSQQFTVEIRPGGTLRLRAGVTPPSSQGSAIATPPVSSPPLAVPLPDVTPPTRAAPPPPPPPPPPPAAPAPAAPAAPAARRGLFNVDNNEGDSEDDLFNTFDDDNLQQYEGTLGEIELPDDQIESILAAISKQGNNFQ